MEVHIKNSVIGEKARDHKSLKLGEGLGMLTKSLQKMKRKKMSRVLICPFLLIFFLMGCASKTIIKSRPSGAEVYIDNVRKGTTPLYYSDTAIAGTTKSVKLEKEGYKTFQGIIRKSEFQAGPCIGGVLVLFPFIWILGYPDEHEFELEKLPEA